MREQQAPSPKPRATSSGAHDVWLVEATRITAAYNALTGMGLDGGAAYCLALLKGAVQRQVMGGPNDGKPG